jgi:hypothetical protein
LSLGRASQRALTVIIGGHLEPQFGKPPSGLHLGSEVSIQQTVQWRIFVGLTRGFCAAAPALQDHLNQAGSVLIDPGNNGEATF